MSTETAIYVGLLFFALLWALRQMGGRSYAEQLREARRPRRQTGTVSRGPM